MKELQIHKGDLTQTRLVEAPDPAIGDGEVLMEIEQFGFSSNNITYAVTGHTLRYWQFFPPQDEPSGDWGLLPVWGFATVAESQCEDLPVGSRLFGYWPTASHMKMTPVKVTDARAIDGAAHRADLPRAYNGYRRVGAAQPMMDNPMMLLSPLYITSWCLWDYLVDNDWFGAERVIIASASSKTSIGLATALAMDPDAKRSLGLTSSGNLAFTEGLGLYDAVLSYDDLSEIDASIPSVIVDMSGNAAVLGGLFQHLDNNLSYCINVGLTHWDEPTKGTGIPKERKEMFFAPGHIQKRSTEWGAAELDKKTTAFMMQAGMKAQAWINYDESTGLDALASVYPDVAAGKIEPNKGLVIKM